LKQVGIGSDKFKQDDDLSEKCLEAKNIKGQLNFDSPIVKSNVCYGFLDKKKRGVSLLESSQRRWFFLISSRPLNSKDYYEKEHNLDSSSLPWWLKFDTLYYFAFEDNNDVSEAKGSIDIW